MRAWIAYGFTSTDSVVGDQAPPPVDPEVLALRAVARLTIPKAVPQIGPPPQINQWKSAFVGYPLWLWTSGQDPVTATVTLEGVTLTLTARRVTSTFVMGERDPVTGGGFGRPVVCAATTPWTPSVAAGQPSATCGFVYTYPSRTARDPYCTYSVVVTDRWSVGWVATGAAAGRGTIALQSTGAVELPVGELQAVRRR